MTRLRKMMLEELQRRNYSAITTRNYLRVVTEFAEYFGKPPDRLSLNELRTYQAYLLRERKLTPGTVVNQVAHKASSAASVEIAFRRHFGKPVDQRTDIWALGIVITEMVTGRSPFHRESPPRTIFAILNEAPKLADEIPLELQRIIYRALSKDAATRYRSASEMLADLEAFRSHLEPSSAESRIPSAPNDVAFRETVEHASRQMWPPATSRANNSFWWLGSRVGRLVRETEAPRPTKQSGCAPTTRAGRGFVTGSKEIGAAIGTASW